MRFACFDPVENENTGCDCSFCGGSSSSGLVPRRAALAGIGAVVAALAMMPVTVEAAPVRLPATRDLSFVNVNTGESWNGVYWRNGKLDDAAGKALARVLRDHRTGTLARINVPLLDALWRVGNRLDADEPWRVLSAYRTPRSQNQIRRVEKTAARSSMHVQGRAVDVTMIGRSPGAIAAVARKEKIGGIGSYARRGFVHLDTGPYRTWRR
jgi:uncharacterized protein YcbK (DUF882 family)